MYPDYTGKFLCSITQVRSMYSLHDVMFRLQTGRSGVRILVGARHFSLLKIFHAGSEAHPEENGYRGSFLAVKWPEREVDRSICICV